MLCTPNRLQHSMNITFICTGKPKHWCDWLHCDIYLWQWSGTEPATSPGPAWRPPSWEVMALFVKVCVCSQVVRENPQPFRASQPSLIKAPWSPTSSRCCPITGSTPALWPRKPLRRPPASLYLPPQPLGENAQGCGGEVGSIPGRIPWRRTWRPASVFLPGKSRGQSLEGYSPKGLKESDTTEHGGTYIFRSTDCFSK